VNTNREQRRYGFTLVEILVVLSIFAILAAVAIPTFARYGVFSKNELQRSSLELHNLLKSARVHASTYRVDTAVVYMLDNFTPLAIPNDVGLPAPVGDSVSGATVRVITRAAVVVKVKDKDIYEPAPGEIGAFTEFPGRMVVLLNMVVLRKDVDGRLRPVEEVYYRSARPRFDRSSDDPADVLPNGLPKVIDLAPLGLQAVHVVFPDTGEDLWLPGHVFKPTGRMETPWGTPERFTIHVTMSPEESVDARLVNPEIPQFAFLDNGEWKQNLITVPIELYRTTGRIQIAK
jgi:prepilin-type N-terminal cleavage/methylation domain-containing protein